MTFGIRSRLFFITLLVIVVVDVLVGVYLEHEMRASMDANIRAELTRHARSGGVLLDQAGRPQTAEKADPLADAAGAATSSRITIVRRDGKVIGDSELSLAQLASVESHADRPELVDAFAAGAGGASRYSDTLVTDMLYVAVVPAGPGPPVAVRAALPLRQIDAAVTRLRTAMALAGLVSLVVASLVLLLLSKMVSRTLQSVVTTARAVAAGDELPTHEEEGLAGSIQRMAIDLENTMGMLAAERNRFEVVLETMDQAVLALDQDGRLTTVNRAARSLLALRPGVEGLKLVEAVRIPGLKRLVEQAQPGQSVTHEFDIPGGRRVEARATAQRDGGVVLVVLDVTEIRRLERVRRDFVANVSHELRTPIAVIRANTETLLGGALEHTERSQSFLEAVLRHADRLGRLVSDLLDISRIEAGSYSLSARAINVRDLVEHVMDTVSGQAETKGTVLAIAVDPELEAWCDRKAMEQVLINLLTNAVKYTPDGGHVEVRGADQGERIRIEVVDDGPGIDPAHRERIFERFYRVDPGRSRDMGGTGLGLSIVRHLVEAMEGKVGVSARSPRGSNFWVTLPAPREPAETSSDDAAANDEPVDPAEVEARLDAG